MALRPFVERVIARLRTTPVDLSRLSDESAPGSIFSGASGVAFFLHEAARLRRDETLLEPARRWSEAAREWAARATREDWGRCPYGFLVGDTGVAYVDALLGARRGDHERALAAVTRIDEVSDAFGREGPAAGPTEIVCGSAGVVCAILDLEVRLPRHANFDAARGVLRRARGRMTATLAAAYGTPLDPGPGDFLGMAHGVVGEIWALALSLGVNHPTVRARSNELAALGEEDQDGFVYWLPSRDGDHSLLGTWCHGMVGHTLFWCEVSRQAGGEDRSRLAARAAKTAEVLAGGGPTLCCGLAGSSLALQRYADTSGDERAGRRAYDQLARAVRLVEADETADEGVFLGLWKGTLGVALVAMYRLHGERTFPCIEPLASPRPGH